MVFRRQDGCAWDEPLGVCVDDLPCESRPAARCAYELTTGAPWDRTLNKCFKDADGATCRWSDECTRIDGAAACAAATCQWTRLRGLRLPLSNQFLGVPFAAAPVGELRWAAPAPLEGWGAAKVFDATRHGARCMPLIYSSLSLTAERATGSAGNSEECLNLNIFTPPAATATTATTIATATATANANANATAAERCAAGGGGERCPRAAKAVMVWVHGGCSSFGSNQAPLYNGAPLAATQDVVVVSLNYRLGGLGFLGHDALRYRDTTGAGSTGNWGTLDAIAALRWVHENIAAFGGDPNRVTLFGQSSGAGLISQLLGAEPAWPYYHRVILESGAGPAWTYQDMRAAYHNFATTANHAGCGAASALPQDTASIAAQVRCLLAAPADVVASGLGHDASGFGRNVYCRDGCAWGPVIDGALLKGRPLDLARSRRTRPHTPLLAGHNLNDGALFVPREEGNDAAVMQRGSPAVTSTEATINYNAIGANRANYTEAARLEYFARRFGPNHVAALGRAYPVPARAQIGSEVSAYFMSAQSCETDFSYACATYWLASENQAPSTSTSSRRPTRPLALRSSSSPNPTPRPGQAPSYIYQFSQTAPVTGLSLHAYEIRYVFGTGHFVTEEERRVSRLTMDYWARS